MANTRPHSPGQTYLAVTAIQKLIDGEPIEPKSCTRANFGRYYEFVEELREAYLVCIGREHSESSVREEMQTLWLGIRQHEAYREIVAEVDKRDLEDAVRGNGHNSSHSSNSSTAPEKYPWPKLDKAALYGPAGTLTLAIDKYTEADPAAILLNILTAFGNVVGHGPHFLVEYSKHPLRLFAVFVGESSKGRKGLSWSTPRHVFRAIDAEWVGQCVTSGLSTGEGLIYHVRDQRIEKQPIKQKGRVLDYEEVIVDAGVADKRLLVIEEEFVQALKVMRREGNILSPVLRDAWDTGNLHPLTKSNPIRATDAHISIVGHITKDELLRHLDSTEQANGFANRFLWVLVKRSKEIPEPTGIPEHVVNPLITELHAALQAAKQIGTMRRDDDAKAFWAELYHDLSASQPGLFGHITARAEAQVMRLACLYAALDRTSVVTPVHLKAGLAVWRYCEASARYIFGDATGDPVVDELANLLRQSPEGKTRTEISAHFGRNKPAEVLERALNTLVKMNLAECRTEETGGRSAERYFAKYPGTN
jgi:hypothetical protein